MIASREFILLPCQALLTLLTLLVAAGQTRAESAEKSAAVTKRVIGPIVKVAEAESDFIFPARVDTGATTSSLHVDEWEIEDEAEEMADNVGRMIRFRLTNEDGQSEWLRRKIVETSVIKTSEEKELRYKVPMNLHCRDVKKRVLVSLNDRSHMTYPVLLGRNFLQDDFVVDVALGKNQGGQLVHVKKQIIQTDKPAPDKTAKVAKADKPHTSTVKVAKK